MFDGIALFSFSARCTGYFPEDSPMEGGKFDMHGHPLYTLQGCLAGQDPYVSCAMDPKIFPYGTKLCCPQLSLIYERQIELRVVDTGSAFIGQRTGRIDICTADKQASEDCFINGTHLFVAVIAK